jgi:hypothetical protein
MPVFFHPKVLKADMQLQIGTNLKLQESFKNIQKQRAAIAIPVQIISILATKFIQLSFPRIFLLQWKVRIAV